MRANREAPPLLPIALLLGTLLFSSAPASGQPSTGPATAVWDLGTLEAGRTYPTSVTARNRCPGRESFAVRIEGARWLRITGPDRLKVEAGGQATTAAEVDLRGLEPGDHRGTVRVECTSCRPPCTQDVELIEVRLRVRTAGGSGSAPVEVSPPDSGEIARPPAGESKPGEPAAPGEGEAGSGQPPFTASPPAGCPSVPPEGAEHPWQGALADPAATADRNRLRDEIAAIELQLGYWRRLCERGDRDRGLAERNAANLAEMRARLEALADELGVELPSDRTCEEEPCCPASGCCAGLDPTTAEGRAEQLRRQRCLIARFRTLNRRLERSGVDFDALLERWREGEGHRETMGAYHDLFQGLRDLIQGARDFRDSVQQMVDELTLEGAKERFGEWLQQGACERVGSAEQCERLRDLLDQAKEAKGFVDAIVDAADTGTFPPELIVDMVDSMADAVVRATGEAVAGWKRFRQEMGAQLVATVRLLRCLEAVNEALAQTAADCPELCARAVAALEAERGAAEARIAASDAAERERAATWRASAEAEIDADFDRGMGAEKKAWFDACCGDREGSVLVQVPDDVDHAACAGLLDGLLRRWVGPPYCFMTDVAVTLDCKRPWPASGARISYLPAVERQRGCCWHGRPEAPPELPPTPVEPGPARPSPGGESTEPAGDRPPHRPPPIPACDCRLAVTAGGAPVAPGAKLPLPTGGVRNFTVRGSCGACSVLDTRWSVQPPPLAVGGVPVVRPPALLLGPALVYGFTGPGTYAVGVTQTCSDGGTCSLDFEVRVPPGGGGGAQVAPTPGESDREGACGDAPCLTVRWRAEDDRGTVQAHRLDRPAPGEVALTLDSACPPPCPTGHKVTWTITGPGGTVVRSGPGLTTLRHDFAVPGSYSVCVSEGGGCGVATLVETSTFFVVEVGAGTP